MNLGGRVDTAGGVKCAPAPCRAKTLRAPTRDARNESLDTPQTRRTAHGFVLLGCPRKAQRHAAVVGRREPKGAIVLVRGQAKTL